MRICIYGAASQTIDPKYLEALEKLCENLAKEGHSLVFGGGSSGMMGAAARGFTKGNGEIIGVITNYIGQFEPIYDKCTAIISTESLAERKVIMEEKAEVFLIAPGGIGTFDEFFQCLTLKELDRHNKPILIFNSYGFYTPLGLFMENCVKEHFIKEKVGKLFKVCNSIDEVIQSL